MNTMRLRACFFSIAAFFLVSSAMVSCSRIGEATLKLQANPLLSGGLGWALVKEAYVRLKESPSDSSRDLDHLRRGSVYRLDARERGIREGGSRGAALGSEELGIWYGIDSGGAKGWVRESELDVYASQAQADKAASAYR
jgi:hypothetical protein